MTVPRELNTASLIVSPLGSTDLGIAEQEPSMAGRGVPASVSNHADVMPASSKIDNAIANAKDELQVGLGCAFLTFGPSRYSQSQVAVADCACPSARI